VQENIMQATKLLRTELEWLNMSFHALIDDMTDEEWTTRLLPGMNVPGYTLWHIARTPDFIVQTGLRHVPEIITQERWATCGALTTPGFGLSASLEEADAIARTVKREDVSAYADAVLAEVVAWLDTLSDDDLDVAPHWHAYIEEYPQYNIPEIVEAPEDPIWDSLLGTCCLHVRGHLTEVSLIKQQFRQAASLPAAATAPTAVAAPSATPELVAAEVGSSQPPRRRWPWGRK
jgi:hypothetical protein